MRLILPLLRVLAWWHERRVRPAGDDFRRANFYATRALRAHMALGFSSIVYTASGVPALPPIPSLSRR